jgi:hypothetical protein
VNSRRALEQQHMDKKSLEWETHKSIKQLARGEQRREKRVKLLPIFTSEANHLFCAHNKS